MRVLIILAIAGAAIAHETVLTASLPLAYHSVNVLEPRTAYEYSSSVHTADYTNHASVKSDSGGLTVASVPVVAVATPVQTVEVKAVPVIAEQATEASVVAEASIASEDHVVVPEPAVHIETSSSADASLQTTAPVVVHEPIVHPQLQYTRQFFDPAFVHVPSAHFIAPAVHSVQTIAIAPQFVHHAVAPQIVHHAVAESTAVATPHASIAIHETVAAAPAFIPVVESVDEHQQIVGHVVVSEGILAEKSQYHSQNELGQAAYGHSEPLQTHNAIQDAAGNKAGSFSYVAPDGRVLTTEYVADENGYRAASNAFPIHEHSRRRRSVAIVPASPLLITTYNERIAAASPSHYTSTYNNAHSHIVPQYVYTTPLLTGSAYYQPYATDVHTIAL